MPKQKPVLTLTSKETGKVVAEVYMLNPGESFEGFGGSRHALPIKKTASLIVRSIQHGISDTEYDITDGSTWAWLARLINEGPTLGVTAAGPEGATG
jgi:hypothetical protein